MSNILNAIIKNDVEALSIHIDEVSLTNLRDAIVFGRIHMIPIIIRYIKNREHFVDTIVKQIDFAYKTEEIAIVEVIIRSIIT